jgi:triosephosphate isomerase (TIM)
VLVAGNWKMFTWPSETEAFCGGLWSRLASVSGVDVVVCPPYTSLPAAVATLAVTPVAVFAQNVHWANEGPFTGEISPAMLLDVGVAGSIVGHSERRQHFGETDETAARRTAAALAAGLRVIACVGESEEEREAGRTELVLRSQVEALADAVGRDAGLTLAYEPVWAIGTGKTATREQAQEAHAFIRSLLDVPVLYGGSVKPENASDLLAQPDVEGALVGGASLDAESFAAICEAAARIRS